MAKQVLMSIVAAVRSSISQLEAYNHMTSVCGGLVGYNYYPTAYNIVTRE